MVIAMELGVHTANTYMIFTFLLPLKAICYFVVSNYFRLRSRTSLFSSLSLSTYSEFALILGAVAVSQNVISFCANTLSNEHRNIVRRAAASPNVW